MHKKSFLFGWQMILLNIVISTATAVFLWACDPKIEDTRPLIPHRSWDCSMPEGIPSPENGELVLEADMTLGNIYDMGQTQYGRRHVIEVTGGSVKGPAITAEVLKGGLDYQLTLSNGAMEIDQINVLQTSDGGYIYMRNCGASADATDVRIVPDFEAPSSSPYHFLNTGKFAGIRELDPEGKCMKLKIYDVSNVIINSNAPGAVRVTQPEQTSDQSWECRTASPLETKQAELYTETVTLAPTISVGKSKNGNRKIAPITGGTATGNIAGRVLFGGADYQLFNATSINIDARYTLATDDGELIIVRNCGRATRAVPTFEASVDGIYSYLNDEQWLSSFPSPNINLTAVKLTIFKSR